MTNAMLRDINGPLAVLRDGTTVLKGKYGFPKTYANRTQAENKATALRAEGVQADVIHRGRPFYVRIIE